MSDKKHLCVPIVICLCFCIFFSSAAYAHKVRVFAYGEGDTIVGETAFSGGRAAKGSKIIVKDAASEKVLTTCVTDDNGKFHFPIPGEAKQKRLDLQIIISVGEGHRGEWLLEADDYLEGGLEGVPTPQKSVAESLPADSAAKVLSTDDERVRQMMEDVLDRKLAPVKRMLSKSQDRGPTLQDILGGLGYLLGLAGIVAYMKSKKNERVMKEKGEENVS